MTVRWLHSALGNAAESKVTSLPNEVEYSHAAFPLATSQRDQGRLKDNSAICITGQIYREHRVISLLKLESPWALRTCAIWVERVKNVQLSRYSNL